MAKLRMPITKKNYELELIHSIVIPLISSERLHDFQDLAAFQSRPVSLDMQTAPDLRLFAKRQIQTSNKWNKSQLPLEISQVFINGIACKDRQVKHQ